MKNKFKLKKGRKGQLFSVQAVKNSFRTISFKQGTYRGGITLLVIALAVMINLIAGQLPASLQAMDLSAEQILEVSSTSKKFLADVEDELKFVVVAQKSETDTAIKTFIEKYADSSQKITVEWVDPVLHPSILTKYSVEENTVVIVNEETAETVAVTFDQILYTGYDSSYNYVQTFDGDGQFTSAINTLTSEEKMQIYTTAGHGEAELPSSVTTLFSKANYTTSSFNSLMTAEIPQDTDLLIIYGPTSDFTDDELAMLKDYIAAGGKVMAVLSEEAPELPKFSSFLAEYGLQETEGYVADTERSYQNQPYYLFPNLALSGEYAADITNEMVMLINTKGFTEVEPTIADVTLSALMKTSDNAYDVTEDEQVQGTYLLAAVATQTVVAEETERTEDSSQTNADTDSSEAAAESDREGQLTVISSTSMMDESLLSAIPTIENSTLFMNMVTANFDEVSNISIEAKQLSSNQNTVTDPGGYSMLMILIIPIGILVMGFIVWWRRRRS